MGKEIKVIDWGVISYKKAWDEQTLLSKELIDRKVANRKLAESVQVAQQHYFIFAEHPHVYTLGRSGKKEHLLLDEKGLKEVDAEFFAINRGGDITYHGFGQVVGYPILDLDEFFTDIGKYIRLIEEVIICMLADFDIKGSRIDGLSGVWIDPEGANPRKICAIGVHLSRWTTMHGFALNANTNLDYFGHIVPCGIDDKAVTSMQAELNKPVDEVLVKERILHYFARLFDAQLKLS